MCRNYSRRVREEQQSLHVEEGDHHSAQHHRGEAVDWPSKLKTCLQKAVEGLVTPSGEVVYRAQLNTDTKWFPRKDFFVNVDPFLGMTEKDQLFSWGLQSLW